MVKLTRQEIDAFLGEDVSIRHRLKLESFLSFGWIFTACFAYSFVFVVTFVVTTQIYGASFYVQQANLPPELAAAIPATEDILQIRSFIFSVLLAATSLAFVFRRGFLVTVIISVTYAVNALLQTWAFSYGLGFQYIPLGGLLLEIAGVFCLIAMAVGGIIYWRRRGRDIEMDF